MAKKSITYAEAIAEIEDIVEKIESNELDIDNLTQDVKRVSELIKFCKAKLRETELEVENILKDFDEE
ncbi:MAG TPA: exodeoxyribonuclease VII small subunit [Bacteroidales bacterium]|jgi:exodeoxyribonuclease VII small subunit|nr:exodeoxyribonuclease VII small subunit [Bacteroidales bacterium]